MMAMEQAVRRTRMAKVETVYWCFAVGRIDELKELDTFARMVRAT